QQRLVRRCSASFVLVLTTSAVVIMPSPVRADDPLPAQAVARFANLALTCIHQQYPNKIAHLMQSDADLAPPRELTPAFYGCYDWHSAVHAPLLAGAVAP